jgi:2-succinyl-5-enolpyruvyl-6-hydroxy-3-cyclohexene-1-carboxylate synthase
VSALQTYIELRAFVDELARCGLRQACTSPGSRCAPLVISLASDPRIHCHSHLDERCAGFFALGAAKASGLAVAVACTSGTAVAELAPAVIEAHEARVPLLVLSADRPAELRERGAGQTIDQLKLYGGAAKWFFEVEAGPAHGDPDHDPASLGARVRFMRTLACRAYWRALERPAGAVHLNFPLREPLVCERPLPDDPSGRPDGSPYVVRPPARPASDQAVELLHAAVASAAHGVVVAGRHERPLGSAVAAFCEDRGWPLLADPLSGARRGRAAIANYDALLRSAHGPGAPDLVLRVGDLPTSKPLRRWLARLRDVPQIALDPDSTWQDPDSVLRASLPLEPAAALAELLERGLPLAPPPRARGGSSEDAGWLASWRSADERAAEAVAGALAGERISEPAVARELGILLPREATLFVASSMPVRDVECFWPVRDDPPRVLCNRGANGIDGTVSAAFGVAAAHAAHGERGPVVLLTGDLALAHDIGGLLAARRLGLALTIVLLNNRGGGIFDFLPVARVPQEIYTGHIATPPGIDFAHAAALYGLPHSLAADLPSFRDALERSLASGRAAIVEVRTDRARNVALHERAWEAVRLAIER